MLSRQEHEQSVSVVFLQDERCCVWARPGSARAHVVAPLLSRVVIALAASFLVLCRILTLGILSLLKKERAFHNCWTCHKRCASVPNFSLAQRTAVRHRFLAHPCSSSRNRQQWYGRNARGGQLQEITAAAQQNGHSSKRSRFNNRGGEEWTGWEEKSMKKRRGGS